MSRIDRELLKEFEQGLDPRHPEKNKVPTHVLGYGEISTVLEIGTGTQTNLAYKRMPLFQTVHEADAYESLHCEYIATLQDRVGLRVASADVAHLVDQARDRVIVYIAQSRFPSEAIGHRAIRETSLAQAEKLVLAVLREVTKVHSFNREQHGELALGLDGQISNWAIENFAPHTIWESEPNLVYLDTSTPLMQKSGIEQLDPELFLRSAPSFLVWILRLLFVQDVMTRYYDLRKVTIDLIANLYKEQRPDLAAGLIDPINAFLSSDGQESAIEPITIDEVRAYYREDKWIWRLYLAFRKVDRALHTLMGKDYPYILPDRVER